MIDAEQRGWQHKSEDLQMLMVMVMGTIEPVPLPAFQFTIAGVFGLLAFV